MILRLKQDGCICKRCRKNVQPQHNIIFFITKLVFLVLFLKRNHDCKKQYGPIEEFVVKRFSQKHHKNHKSRLGIEPIV